MKFNFKAFAACSLAVFCLTGSASVVFGADSNEYSEKNIIQSEENLDASLSAAGLSLEDIDLKKADAYKVVFFAGGMKYVYIFDGGGSDIKDSHITDISGYSFDRGYRTGDKLYNDEGKEAEKAAEEAEKKAEKAAKAAEKSAKAAKKAAKVNN